MVINNRYTIYNMSAFRVIIIKLKLKPINKVDPIKNKASFILYFPLTPKPKSSLETEILFLFLSFLLIHIIP